MGKPEPVRDQDISFVWSEDELEVYKMPHPIRKVKVNIHHYDVEELAHMKEMFKIRQIFIGLKKNKFCFLNILQRRILTHLMDTKKIKMI